MIDAAASAMKRAARPSLAKGGAIVVRSLSVQRLVALFFGGMVLFNFPLLALWDRDLTVFGLPLFPTALFVGWGVLIAALGWIVERMDH